MPTYPQHPQPVRRGVIRRGVVRRGAVVLAAVAMLATALTACTGGGSGSGQPLQFSICCAWGTTWSYNEYSPLFIGAGQDFALQTLGLQQPPTTSFIPRLAKSWTVSGDSITVRLQPNAKWDDGTALTSKDVVNTILLDGTAGRAVWNDITDVAASGTSGVTVKIRKGVPAAQALADVLGVRPVPSSQYGTFVTPQLKSQEQQYFDAFATDPTTAAKLPAKSAMDKVFSTMVKFDPKKIVGDGPYQLVSANTQQAELVKSKTYWNASKINVPKIMFDNGQTNDVIYGPLTSGRYDFSNVYLPGPIAQKLTHTPDMQIALPGAFEFILQFNDAKYPLSITKVRQALAYAMDRDDMVDSAYGKVKAGGAVEDHPDGLTPAVENVWLTRDQINSLNTYSHSTSKAASLLTSAGFTKSGNTWMTPKGKAFTLDIEVNSATTDITASAKAAAGALTDFGIKTSVTAVPAAKLDTDRHAGNFDIAPDLEFNLNPIKEIGLELGRNFNFSTSGNYKGQRGIGYGPGADVPGIGHVDNVPATIDQQGSSVPPGPQLKKLAWSWAQLVNQQVPYLQYANKVYQFSFSTVRYTHWPPLDSKVWDLIGYSTTPGFIYAQEQGYIKPR